MSVDQFGQCTTGHRRAAKRGGKAARRWVGLGASVLALLWCPIARSADVQPSTSSPPATTRYPAPDELQRYDFNAEVPCPFCGANPKYPAGRHGLHWHSHWRRVGVGEYITTPVLFGTSLGTQYFVSERTSPAWTGPMLFDKAVHNGIVFGTSSARYTAKTISDIFSYVSVAYPYVVDTALVTWIGRQSPEVAWQMFIINSQAYSLTLALTAVTKRLTGRERPYVQECAANPDGYPCGQSTGYQSFFSGHAAFTATGAGLVCAHHEQLRLYGNPYADAAACVTAVSLSLATGVLRMTSDNHWATDVVAGDLIGFVSGYLLPTLVYYREFHFVPPPGEEPQSTMPPVAVLPWLSPSTLGLTATGLF